MVERNPDAERVLAAILRGQFDTPIPGASRGIRWLEERGAIIQHSRWFDRPIAVSQEGHRLARQWGIEPS